MDEKNVALLATLLKKPNEEVAKALETEGGLEPIVSDFKTQNQVFNLNEFAKLKQNLKKETIEKLEEADIPEPFKAKAIGWKLEKMEEELKTKYQFTDDFNGLTDLVDKIVTTKTKPPRDGDKEVDALKKRIVELESEYKTQLTEKQKEFDSSIIQSDLKKAIKALDLDYEGEVLEKQKGLVQAAFNDVYRIERKDGQTVVFKGDDIVKDSKFDPLPLNEVFKGITQEYGFQTKSPEPGGHGGVSSKRKSGLKSVTWQEYLEKNNVKPNTNEADKLYAEWNAVNK